MDSLSRLLSHFLNLSIPWNGVSWALLGSLAPCGPEGQGVGRYSAPIGWPWVTCSTLELLPVTALGRGGSVRRGSSLREIEGQVCQIDQDNTGPP